jgi:hypothetical protein
MFANELSREDLKPAGPEYETIIVTTKGKVGLITLHRPHALNALNTLLISELNRALGCGAMTPRRSWSSTLTEPS